MNCPRCLFSSDIPFQQCPNCLDPMIVLPLEEADLNAPVKLSEIEARPIGGCITDTPFDSISDHGVPYGAGILLAGPPGSGKSSWGLIVGSRWGQRAGQAWYCPFERGPEALRRDADRLKVDAGYLWVCSQESSPFSFYAPRGLVIVDSLNHFASQNDMSLPIAVELLTHHANTRMTTVIMVAHVTKEWDIAGPEKIKHEADVVVNLYPGMGHSSKKQPLQGIICDEKNRYGALWRRLSVEPWNL